MRHIDGVVWPEALSVINQTTAIGQRLGLNVPREVWPTTARLRGYQAAGFGWVQLHSPPRRMLLDQGAARRHARALATLLHGSGLRLVLHAPDELSAGEAEHDAAFESLLEYASLAGAELIAYHGLNFPAPEGELPSAVRERASLEESALPGLLQRAHQLGVTVAIENLAPVYPGSARQCHDPLAVRDLVRRLASPAAGMLLDLGHLHITSDQACMEIAQIAGACAPDAVLIHVHDNLGARRHDVSAPGLDPLRVDLHLAPGSGTLPWSRLAPALRDCTAPLVLEVQPQHRSALGDLHARAATLLGAVTAPVAV